MRHAGAPALRHLQVLAAAVLLLPEAVGAQPLVVYAGGLVPVCEGGQAILGGSPTASGGVPPYTYVWQPAQGLDNPNSANPVCTPMGQLVYQIQVIDAAGNVSIDQVFLLVSTPAQASIPTGPHTTCANAPVPIAVITNTQGLWSSTGSGSFADPSGASTTYTPGGADTNATVTITWTTIDPDGPGGPCEAASVSSTITVLPIPNVDAGADQFSCAGSPVQLNSTASGGTGALTYNWSPPIGLNDPTSPDPIATPINSTVYLLVVTDAAGCSNGDDLVLLTNPGAFAALPPALATCNNATLPVEASTNRPGGWSVAPPQAGTVADPSSPASVFIPSPAFTGSAILTWTTIDPDGAGPCPPAAASATISVYGAPGVSAGSDVSLCAGGSTTLSALPSGGTPGFLFSWSPGTGLSSTTASTTSADPADTTTYTVTVTDANGCSGSDAVTVAVIQQPFALIPGPLSTCGSDVLFLNVFTNTAGQWSTSGVGQILQTTEAFTPYLPGPGDVGTTITVTWTTSDPDGSGPCAAASATTGVQVFSPPVPQITWVDSALVSSAGQSYQWLLNGQPIAGATAPTWDPLVPGTYAVAVTDANGCTGTSDPFALLNTGIPQQDRAGGLHLWPVPCSAMLHVALPADMGGRALLELVDAQGRVVDRTHVSGPLARLDVQARTPGIHLVRLTCGNRSWQSRFLIP